MIYKIKDTVELRKGLVDWSLSYYDLKGVKHTLATFTDGPLQNRIMVDTARAVVKAKMLPDFTIDASEETIAKLYDRVPDLVETL